MAGGAAAAEAGCGPLSPSMAAKGSAAQLAHYSSAMVRRVWLHVHPLPPAAGCLGGFLASLSSQAASRSLGSHQCSADCSPNRHSFEHGEPLSSCPLPGIPVRLACQERYCCRSSDHKQSSLTCAYYSLNHPDPPACCGAAAGAALAAGMGASRPNKSPSRSGAAAGAACTGGVSACGAACMFKRTQPQCCNACVELPACHRAMHWALIKAFRLLVTTMCIGVACLPSDVVQSTAPRHLFAGAVLLVSVLAIETRCILSLLRHCLVVSFCLSYQAQSSLGIMQMRLMPHLALLARWPRSRVHPAVTWLRVDMLHFTRQSHKVRSGCDLIRL